MITLTAKVNSQEFNSEISIDELLNYLKKIQQKQPVSNFKNRWISESLSEENLCMSSGLFDDSKIVLVRDLGLSRVEIVYYGPKSEIRRVLFWIALIIEGYRQEYERKKVNDLFQVADAFFFMPPNE
jgi:hypothetical protein